MSDAKILREAEGSMPKIYINPRFRPIGGQIKDAFLLVYHQWAPLLVAQLIMFFLTMVITAVAIVAFILPIFFSIASSMTWDNVLLFLMSSYFWIAMGVIIVPTMIIGAWSTAAMTWAVGYKGERKMAPIGKTLGKGFSFFLPFLFLYLLILLACVGSMILFFIPAVILCIGFSLAWYVRVYEDVTVLEAMGTSWEITKGYKWSILGRILLLLLIVWGVSLAVGAAGMIPFVGLLTIPIQFAANLIITPYAVAYVYCIYEDVRAVRKAVYPMRGRLSAAMVVLWVLGAIFMAGIVFLASYLIQRFVV